MFRVRSDCSALGATLLFRHCTAGLDMKDSILNPLLKWRSNGKLILLLIAILLATGCSNKDQLEVAPVSGSVTIDGKPLSSGVVIFTPGQGRAAKGVISSSGTFELSTYQNNDGAIVGSHGVAVVPLQAGEGDEVVSTKIPPKYHSALGSGIVLQVKAGAANEFPIELKSSN